MDSCKRNDRATVNEITVPTATEVISAAVGAVASFGAFIVYIISYGITSLLNFLASDRAVYIIEKCGRVFRGISISLGFYIVIGVVGGLEAGLISFAVGVPLCLILFACINIISKDAD